MSSALWLRFPGMFFFFQIRIQKGTLPKLVILSWIVWLLDAAGVGNEHFYLNVDIFKWIF